MTVRLEVERKMENFLSQASKTVRRRIFRLPATQLVESKLKVVDSVNLEKKLDIRENQKIL